MATIVTNLTCELTGAVQVKVLQGNLFSADNAGNTINVFVTNHGQPATLGGTISANVIRGDGTTVAVSGAIDGNRAYIILPQACYAVPGVIQIIVKNTESSTVTTIAAVVANVYESTTDTVVDPGTIIPSVASLVEAIEDAVAEIPAGYNACFAPAYSTSSTYALGQYVTYSGYLYRCTTAITSSESWTAAHWTQVALANDVSALKSAITNEDNLVSSIHNLVDYDPQEYHAEKVEASTTSTAFGIDRSGQVVSVTGGPISSAAIIKLSGSGSRTTASGTVKAWTPTLNLKTGHKYRVSAKYVSGSFTDPQGGNAFALSLYKGGESASSGTAFIEETATGRIVGRTIDGDGTNYNLALYIRSGATLTNLVLAVTVEDVTDNSNDYTYFDTVINSLHGLVNYGYGSKKTTLEKDTSGTASDKYVGVERFGTFVTLNYDGEEQDRAKRVRISGDVLRSSGAMYRDWVGNLQLTEGKEYRLKIKKISGSGTLDGESYLPSLVVYESLGQTTIATLVSTSTTQHEYSLIAPSGAVSLAIYIRYESVLTNLVVECTVSTEISSSDGVKDYYIAELRDTIAKVRSVNDEPSLVFPWVTDIHRFKASVQTFDEMIANMKYVASAVKCDFILNTGDTIEGDQQKDTSLGQAYDAIAAMKEIGEPLFYCEGNHDNNPYISSGALVFTLKQCFGGFFAATKGVTFNVNENGTDYYFDFDNLGVRIVSVNSCNATIATNYGFGNSTAAWLANALNTDHTVILMSHVSPIKEHVWNNINPGNADDIRDALSAFVGGGGKLIIMTGHSHVDAEFVSPYVEVTDVCQKFEQANTSSSQYQAISGQIDGIRNPARTASTYTADAWTMCVFKPFSNELDLIRFGAGVDRYIHCTPISSGTLTTRLSGEVTWSSSNTSIATVSDGTITVVTTGRCAIIAKDSTGNIEVWIVQT